MDTKSIYNSIVVIDLYIVLFPLNVIIAMDHHPSVCPAETMNLFVESYLELVRKVLETSSDLELQILATQTFIRFANVEEHSEDHQTYYRSYDFFVIKFATMCHNHDDENTSSERIRFAGLRGLQAVLTKTISDGLVENIWEHIDLIVPSLLFNMQNSCLEINEHKDASILAKICFIDVIRQTTFGRIRSVIKPALKYFDDNNLWEWNKFVVDIFQIIMLCTRTQISYIVIEELMRYLEKTKSYAKRTNIAGILCKIIAIAARENVGPSVFEIINFLLRSLKFSVNHGSNKPEEKFYQKFLIAALDEFTYHLPNYEKKEIITFIMNNLPCIPEYAGKIIDTRKPEASYVQYPTEYKPTKTFSHVDNPHSVSCSPGMTRARTRQSSFHRALMDSAKHRDHLLAFTKLPSTTTFQCSFKSVEKESIDNKQENEAEKLSSFVIPYHRALMDSTKHRDYLLASTKLPSTSTFQCSSEITIESVKRETNDIKKREKEAEKRNQINETFRKAPSNEPKRGTLRNKLKKFFKFWKST